MEEDYKDKQSGLIAFGVVELIGGAVCGLFSLISLLPLLFASTDMPACRMVPGVLVYVFLAVWLVGMGIATIRGRRWARVLMLAASWFGLACGILAMGMMFFVLPKSFSGAPSEVGRAVIVVVFIMLAFFYLLVPAVGILFYGNRNVRATFEHMDPDPCWAERVPLPVLILFLMLALSPLSFVMLSCMNFTVQAFGVLLTGWQGALVALCGAACCIWLSVGVFRMRPAAWWGVLALLAAAVVSQLITFGRIDMVDYYTALGYSDQMMLQMERSDLLDRAVFKGMAFAYAVPGFVFLLWVKRFFKTENAAATE